jgi:hypothetical protein
MGRDNSRFHCSVPGQRIPIRHFEVLLTPVSPFLGEYVLVSRFPMIGTEEYEPVVGIFVFTDTKSIVCRAVPAASLQRKLGVSPVLNV